MRRRNNSGTQRALREIAREIRADWKNVHFTAQPYLAAMSTLTSVNDKYGLATGDDIVLRFLTNATSWRGDTARRVKAELNAMVKTAHRDNISERKWEERRRERMQKAGAEAHKHPPLTSAPPGLEPVNLTREELEKLAADYLSASNVPGILHFPGVELPVPAPRKNARAAVQRHKRNNTTSDTARLQQLRREYAELAEQARNANAQHLIDEDMRLSFQMKLVADQIAELEKGKRTNTPKRTVKSARNNAVFAYNPDRQVVPDDCIYWFYDRLDKRFPGNTPIPIPPDNQIIHRTREQAADAFVSMLLALCAAVFASHAGTYGHLLHRAASAKTLRDTRAALDVAIKTIERENDSPPEVQNALSGVRYYVSMGVHSRVDCTNIADIVVKAAQYNAHVTWDVVNKALDPLTVQH